MFAIFKMLNVNGKWSSLISPYTQHNFWSLNSLYSNLPIKFSCFFFGNSIHRSSQCVYTFWRNQLIIYIWINLPFNSFVMIRLFTFYFENLSIGPSKKKLVQHLVEMKRQITLRFSIATCYSFIQMCRQLIHDSEFSKSIVRCTVIWYNISNDLHRIFQSK